jgi:hypothetical protein
VLSDTQQLSDAKRTLLDKYLRRDLTPARTRPRRITPRPPGSRVPLSFGQEPLWLAAQVAAGAPIDTEFITVNLGGPLDVAVLERSFDEVIRRHEILRTTISTVDGRPTQVIHPRGTCALSVVDLQSLPPSERELEAIRLATLEGRRAFNLAHGPWLRATLMHLDDTNHKLFLVLHHIAFDCFAAYTVFLPELAALYAAFAAGRPSPLPELPIQYADTALWQREQLQGKKLEEDLRYWRNQLSGSPTLELPTDHPRPPAQTFRGAIQSAELPRQLATGLEILSRREGVTPFMTLAAAFQILLHHYAGQDDIVVGTETGSRNQPEIEPLIGFFLNTLVLRTDLSGNPTVRELLRRVRQVTSEAYSHCDVPFGHLLAELSPKQDPGRHPLFQVMIRLAPRLAPLEGGWTVNQVDVDPGASKFDMTLDLYDTAEGIMARLEYNTHLFQASTITRFLADFQAVLKSIVANPEQPIGDLRSAAARETRYLEAPIIGGKARQNDTFVAPTLLVHQQLIAIWEDLLDVRPIGIRDDFFNLGGNSLLAVRMVVRIEQVWGKKLALATLFAGPTIAQLAQALLEARDDASGVRTPVVPLQTGGSRRPFFFLHGHYLGTASYCLTLARALGPDQPFYALDPYRLNDLAIPPTLEEIAATHLEVLRAIQPEGPYLLGGFCNGGLVAYEMARQLSATGQTVDLLVLMDPMPLAQHSRLLYRALHGVLALVRLSPAQQVAWFVCLRHLVQQLYNHLRGYRGDVEDVVPAHAAHIVTDEARQHAYPGLLHWSVLAYRPPSVYPGKVTFFWPADEPWHARWWRPVAEATAVEEHLLPGTQNTWKTEHLPALSECLRMCLDNAHAAVKAPVTGGHTDD